MKKILLSSFIALGIFANAQCETLTAFPVTWNFEGSPAFPTCFSVEKTADATNWNAWTADGNYGTTAGTHYLNNAMAAGKTGSAWVFTRGFEFTAGHIYSVKFVSFANNNSNNLILKVAYGLDKNTAGMTIPIGEDNTVTLTHEDQNYTFTAATTGTYYIGFNALTETANATQSSILVDNLIINDESLAVSDVNGKFKIVAFPNPVKDVLKLSDISGVKSITVSDMTGRQVKTLAPNNEINLSNLKAGNYVVSLKMENGSVQTINTIKK